MVWVLVITYFNPLQPCSLVYPEQLCNVLRRIGFIGYFDGTGGLTRVKGCALESHIIHSMLSFKPQELLLNMEDFDYGANIFMAMGPMEHISHWKTRVTFTDV